MSSSTTTTTTTTTTVPTTATSSLSSPITTSNYLTNLGLGYSIAIALGFLVLLSTVLLASYIYCRARNRRNNDNGDSSRNSPSDGIILPSIIFVAQEDEELGGRVNDDSVAVGLDQAVINSYPKFQFTKEGSFNGNNIKNDDATCSICLCEYKDLEVLRMMPECRHYFHLCCIDPWLKLNGSCPVCRNSPLPTPLSTPLSEVVPLSQYAADRRRR